MMEMRNVMTGGDQTSNAKTFNVTATQAPILAKASSSSRNLMTGISTATTLTATTTSRISTATLHSHKSLL